MKTRGNNRHLAQSLSRAENKRTKKQDKAHGRQQDRKMIREALNR
jgi:hypothetical protein